MILNNGLTVLYKQLLGVHSFSFDLFVKAGVRYENKELNGISNLLGSLHYRGINGYDQKQLFHTMESIGSSIQIYTYKDFIRFSMKVHPNYYKTCVDIFKNIFDTYYWDEKVLENEKQTILKQIDEDNQYVNLDEIVSKEYFCESSLSLPIKGCYETVNAISIKQITDFKSSIFNKGNLVFCFSGPVCNEHIEYIEKNLSSVVLNNNRTSIKKNIVPKDFGKRIKHIFWDYYDWDYIDVDVSFDVSIDKKEVKDLDILNCILGEGLGSRLQTVLREELAVLFDIKSFVEKYDDLNILHIQYSVEQSKFLPCFQTVINVLNQLKNSIDNKDIETSLPFYKENLDFLLDEPQKYNFHSVFNSFILNNCCALESVITPGKLMALADKVFVPTNIFITCLGNDSEIDKNEIEIILNDLKNQSE